MIFDLTGYRTGRLVVLNMFKKNNRTYCHCQCDCGNLKDIRADAISSGITKSCGCLQREATQNRAEDLTGQTFGLWTVLERRPKPDTTTNRGSYWLCRCKCGKERVVWGKSLCNGTSTSCGCTLNRNLQTDLTNQRFGNLFVLQPIKEANQPLKWKCQCDCGNITTASTHSLRAGHKISCGCIMSKGEYKIESILQEHNIIYKKQYSFQDLVSIKNVPLRFDFCIFNQDDSIKCLIEYQGIQHYKHDNSNTNGWNTLDHLQTLQEHDKLKREYCQKHKYDLIEISYLNFKYLNWLFLKEKCNL